MPFGFCQQESESVREIGKIGTIIYLQPYLISDISSSLWESLRSNLKRKYLYKFEDPKKQESLGALLESAYDTRENQTCDSWNLNYRYILTFSKQKKKSENSAQQSNIKTKVRFQIKMKSIY